MTRLTWISMLLAAVGTAGALAPQRAEACGGTFCDVGPTAMPVDQTGENILFVMGADYVEAHIQIQYDPTTEAAKFAWVVPVLTIPEFAVGSQQLFTNLLSGTVPTYGFTPQFDGCDPVPPGDGGGGDDGGGFIQEPDAGGTGPDVVLEETVGAFDIVVLSGGTAEEVMQWLGDNGYQQDPAAQPILEEYLLDDYMFAAFKLTNGAETEEIHPVTLTFRDSTEACIPLRLTRIAAQDDMRVRAFFLGDGRAAPRGYRHVEINPLRIDWSAQGVNYNDAITMAVDEDPAIGKAFVTEYAGPTGVVSDGGVHSALWDPDAFRGMNPVDVIDTLMGQGFLYCDSGFCEFYHQLIEGLLAGFLPTPGGVVREDFYSCLACYEALIDQGAWDGDAFADAVEERIVEPGRHAADLLQTWPYLTRLFTTISPVEMTADPFFHENVDLEDVTSIQRIATQRVLCDGDSVWMLPDGREVYVPAGAAWPSFSDDMPYAELIEVVPRVGAPLIDVANTALIDEQLREYNCQFDWPSAEECSDDGGTGTGTGTGTGSGDDGGGGDGGDDGGGGDGGGDDGGGGDGGGGDDGGATGGGYSSGDASSRGCACSADGTGAPAALLGLLALAWGRRRRLRP